MKIKDPLLSETVYKIIWAVSDSSEALALLHTIERNDPLSLPDMNQFEHRDKATIRVVNTVSMLQFLSYLGTDYAYAFYTQVHLLEEFYNAEEIDKVILGCNLNYRLGDICIVDPNSFIGMQPNVIQGRIQLFIKRLQLTVQFLKQKSQQFIFHFHVIPTNSDPHKDAKQALFLRDRLGAFRVYKPRSLQIDNFLCGRGGIIPSVTANNPSLLPLPSMEIDEDTQTEQMMERVGGDAQHPITLGQALVFFQQLGELECIATVLNIADLHADNIMFTSHGPIIIDAECAIMYKSDPMIRAFLIGVTQCRSADAQLDIANALFYVQTHGQVFDSVDMYKQNLHGEQGAFQTGFTSMSHVFQSNQEAFLRVYGNRLQQIVQPEEGKTMRVRVVPQETARLRSALNAYHTGIPIKEVVTITMGEMMTSLKSQLIIGKTSTYLRMDYDIDMFRDALHRSFDAGTIPALEFEIQSGHLYLDDTLIGKTIALPDLDFQDEMISNIIKITRDRIQTLHFK